MDIMGIFQIICLILVNITGCKNFRGNLTCSDNKLIHVERVSIWKNSGNGRNDMTGMSCGENLTNGDTGLTPGCNGQTSCIETVDYTPSDCNGILSTLFNYRCINRDSSLIDMCDSIGRNAGNRFFLTSPGFPQVSNNTQSECRCNIRGTNITSITILDLRLVSSMDGTMSSLYIQYGDKTENITSRINTSKTLYNYKLQSPSATTADISFTSYQINGQKLWMEIKGIALYVSCNNNNTTSTSDSTQSISTLTSSTISPSTISSITPISTYSSTDESNTSTTLPSSMMTTSTTVQTASTISPSTISSNMSTTIVSTSSSTEETNTSSMVTNSTTVQTASTISPSTNSSPAPTTLPSLPTAASVKLTGIIAGVVVSGIIIIIVVVVVILCVKIHRKLAAAPPPNVDVHVNVSSNNYFVLEVPTGRDSVPFDAKVNLDYQESNLNNIKSDSSTNPGYSVVETGHTKNQDYSKVYKSDQKHKSVAYSKPVEDVEILQNDLYIPFQPPLVSRPNPSESCESKEPVPELTVEGEILTDFTDSIGIVDVPIKHKPPSDPWNITDSNQPSDVEIMENELYVSYDNSKVNQPSDVEIMENDLYASYDNSTANQPSDIKVNQPSDIKANQPSDIKVNQPDVEIMENDLYVSYDNSTANQPSDIEINQPSDIEIMENDLYVPFEKSK